MNCHGCKFWKQDLSHADIGECRRNAPTVIYTPGELWTAKPRDIHLFPCTRDGDWCGEYQPR
jgi:hypothetical protein